MAGTGKAGFIEWFLLPPAKKLEYPGSGVSILRPFTYS